MAPCKQLFISRHRRPCRSKLTRESIISSTVSWLKHLSIVSILKQNHEIRENSITKTMILHSAVHVYKLFQSAIVPKKMLLVKNAALIWINKVTILGKRRLYNSRIIIHQVTKAFLNQSKSLSWTVHSYKQRKEKWEKTTKYIYIRSRKNKQNLSSNE